MPHRLPATELWPVVPHRGKYVPAYGSDLRKDFLARKIDAWTTGQTHWAQRGTLQGEPGQIAFLANMMGHDVSAHKLRALPGARHRRSGRLPRAAAERSRARRGDALELSGQEHVDTQK